MSLIFHEHQDFESERRRFFWYDHFLGDSIADEWSQNTSGGSTISVVDSMAGGVCRLRTGATTNDHADIDWDYGVLNTLNQVTYEVRFSLSHTSNLVLIIELQNGNDNRLMFSETASDWQTRNEAYNVGASQNTGQSLDTDWHIFRRQLHNHGGLHIHSYIDDVEVDNSPRTDYIPTHTSLYPKLYIATDENVAKDLDLDYVAVRM